MAVRFWATSLLLCGVVSCGRTESDPVEQAGSGGEAPSPAGGGTGATAPVIDDAGPAATGGASGTAGMGMASAVGGAPTEPACSLLGNGPEPASAATGYRVTGYLAAAPVTTDVIAELVAEDQHTCATEAGSGAVWCWGLLPEGAAAGGEAALSPRRVPELDGAFPPDTSWPNECSVRGGAVYCGGDSAPALEQVVFASTAEVYACAIRSGGEVWCWGLNDYGQLGSDADGSRPVQVHGVTDATRLDLSRGQACALSAAGPVICWGTWDPCLAIDCGWSGYRRRGPELQTGLPAAIDFAQAAGKLCVLTADGDVWCRTSTAAQPAARVPYTETVVHVGSGASRLVMGNAQLCALASDHVACWGGNFFGAVGNGTWQNDVPCPTPVLAWSPDP